MHNLTSYDSHFLIRAIQLRHGRLSVIPLNSQKYLSFQIGRCLFLDSANFAQGSLESLIASMDESKLKITREYFPSPELFNLVKRKGCYPYEFSTLDLLRKDETEFMKRKDFFSQLYHTDCAEEDYAHAKEVWTKFNCKSFRDYHRVYLLTDVSLLADFVEHFRDLSLESYKLDAMKYYSNAGLSWSAMLKMTDIELDLLTDKQMFNFFESNLRGGLCCASKRHIVANNKYCVNFDPSKPSTYIFFIDCNALYATCMLNYLPYKDFRWLTGRELKTIDFLNHPADAEFGFALEVDLTYPSHLHDGHNDLPLAPQNVHINFDMLSEYQKTTWPGNAKASGSKKLTPTFQDRRGYGLHYLALQLYTEFGMELVKIHRGVIFRQKPWIRPYVEFHQNKRSKATSEFDNKWSKNGVNIVYGKSIENVRNKVSINLFSDEKKAAKCAAKPNYKNSTNLREDLVAIESARNLIRLDKPIYCGFSVLEFSKIIMYRFHYGIMSRFFKNKAKVAYMDTDSFLYEIETDDLYEDLKNPELNKHFDFSNYDESLNPHNLYSDAQKLRNGLFKDELKGMIPTEYVGLRAKSYSILYQITAQIMNEIKKSKSVKRQVVQRFLTHKHYRSALLSNKRIRIRQNTIRSFNHKLSTIHQRRLALCSYDNKRFILDDNVHTLAYGHIKIPPRSCPAPSPAL